MDKDQIIEGIKRKSTGKMEVLSLWFVLFNSGKIGVWLEKKKVQNSSLRP